MKKNIFSQILNDPRNYKIVQDDINSEEGCFYSACNFKSDGSNRFTSLLEYKETLLKNLIKNL